MYKPKDHHLYSMIRKLSPETFDFDEEEFKKQLPFPVPEHLPRQVCSALNTGKHIIFIGAPGTGKTSLAEAVCRAAYAQSLSFGKGIFTTATADWSTFDTLGGYIPDVQGGGRLTFTPGIITRSILDTQWLILDEINRADIDKAIGPFFSVLSNQEVILPFKNSSGTHYSIRIGKSESTDTEFYVHPNWRIIGTMNDFDKMSLYKLSFAFLRRFAMIRIPTPRPAETIKIIKEKCPECNINNGLARLTEIIPHREIGPAVFLDMAGYIVNRSPSPEQQAPEHTREALELYLLPQFQGLPKYINEKVAEIIRKTFPQYKFNDDIMEFVM